ncbi:dipeptidyl-peptidase-4 [Dysgonomonas macrotermitis]|uniref:Dipeptidyl-peptidase-4 n=2 Tax=Dysgonomonas macrotermitis TaxID=1346286 RepID=A0A1M5CC09_9BACT|nr:S9 family peptidase [Dysgonomonas macrotermitis]SHF52293.1 dipeptidyl-peptidase-4 [Dysgonomonas macrotermitis]
MRMFKNLLFTVVLLISTTIMAQSNQPPLSLEDLIPGGNSFNKYRVQSPSQVQWWADTPVQVKGDSVVTLPIDEKQTSKVIISKDNINKSISSIGKEPLATLGTISFPYGEEPVMMLTRGSNSYLYNLDSQTIEASFSLPKDASNNDFSKEGKAIAYTRDNNLYILDTDSRETAITADTDKGIVNGQAVHRNEFGISKGTFWSPTGNQLAFYRMDETMVTDYPLVDISTRIAELKDIKYPMAGMKSHHVTVGVFNRTTGQTTFLKTGTPKEKYLTNIAWSPDEKYIYLAELNRGQDTCKVVRYDAVSGKLDATLFVETHPKYVEPEHPVLFLKNDPNLFIWQSERDGYNHLYLYDTSGNMKKQITSGKWDVTDVLGFDVTGNYLYYVSTEVTPLERHIYQLSLKNGKTVQLSKEAGVHSALLSESGKYLIDRYTSQYNPGKIAITDTKRNKSYEAFAAKNPYKDITLPEITLGSLKADDGKSDLYYRLVKPLNFDPSVKYPTIVYVYGGPHSQLVDNSWMGQVRGWDIYMAEKGYIVFTLDNRGTANRGIDFENITHRQLGVVETQDQMTGVNYLKSLPYVDADRIGVHGWSFGGFMTLNLMLRHPETFKVGVAGGPVTNWKYYEIMYGERYMDSPKENPEGYAETSMVDKAGDLKGRLMLIHGDEDPTVVMQHSLQFLKSAIKKGTHPDFFVYPGHGHNMIGRDRVHLHEHITRYFDDFLK